MEWGKISNQLSSQNWLILLILSAGSSLLMRPDFTLGIIFGGLIIIANFKFLQHTIRCAFSSEGVMKGNKLSIIGKYYLRLSLMGMVIYALITYGLVHPVGMAVGLSTVVLSIIQMGIRMAWKTSSGEAI
jgi:hypothetical protein